jgi:hypothetical protein
MYIYYPNIYYKLKQQRNNLRKSYYICFDVNFVYSVTQKSLDIRGNILVEFYWQNACTYWVPEMFEMSSFYSDTLCQYFRNAGTSGLTGLSYVQPFWYQNGATLLHPNMCQLICHVCSVHQVFANIQGELGRGVSPTYPSDLFQYTQFYTPDYT